MKLRVVGDRPLTPRKVTKTEVDTILVTKDIVGRWKLPAFQRPLRVNEKVRALAEQIKNDGVLPGMLTLGKLNGDVYLVDGQHRVHAFLIAETPHGYADVRTCHFETLADMADEFVTLNSQIARMGPDDVLRGLEASSPALQAIRRQCPFIGYDQVRRSEKAPIVGMSAMLRSWAGSAPEVPSSSGLSAAQRAQSLTEDEAERLIEFATICFKAFGRERESWRLWGSLNLTVTAWIFRRTVTGQYSAKSIRLTKDMFTKCLMSVAADGMYSDWLVGRGLSERDRSPCYQRIRQIFVRRIMDETGQKAIFPSPSWVGG
jgi:hypothetical protein